jgi:hypothetical protein
LPQFIDKAVRESFCLPDLRGQSRNFLVFSFFIFAESLVQRVYYLGFFIYPRGSKSLSVKSQFSRVHGTYDFPLLFYFTILVDLVQLQDIDRIGDTGPEKTFYQQRQDKQQMVAIFIV